MHKQFTLQDLKGRAYKEDLGVDGRLDINMSLKQIGWEGVNRIRLADDRIYWRALVNVVINFGFHKSSFR
jgi:hypothetical protein